MPHSPLLVTEESLTQSKNVPRAMIPDDLPASLMAQANAGPPGLGDALRMWWAGVSAVTPEQIFSREVRIEQRRLLVGDEAFDLRGIRRIVVVGAGKASGGMATALYSHCLHQLAQSVEIVGWINAPAGSFRLGSAGPIQLHAARPPGINEPTAAAVAGTTEIIKLVEQCGPNDLCVVLISGGGSALLAAPIDGISLHDKQVVARKLAAAGANIAQLNSVRRGLSRVKGGGLAAMCHARQLVALIISDVIGDPLETIASGPTVPSSATSPQAALKILAQLGLLDDHDLKSVVTILQQRCLAGNRTNSRQPRGAQKASSKPCAPISNIILANNATAVDAAGTKAVELGYRYIMQAARSLEGDVAQLAESFGGVIEQLVGEEQFDCWISGGEPTVILPPAAICGRGGRNQQLALLSMLELTKRNWPDDRKRFPAPLLFLAVGTDGEDGPTPAAGAWFDCDTPGRLAAQQLDAADAALRADAYTLFERIGGLVVSDQTGTNVCDLRIALKARPSAVP